MMVSKDGEIPYVQISFFRLERFSKNLLLIWLRKTPLGKGTRLYKHKNIPFSDQFGASGGQNGEA